MQAAAWAEKHGRRQFPGLDKQHGSFVTGDPTKPAGSLSLGGIVFGLETATSAYYFPQLAFGGGWQTTLTYVDYSPQSTSCQTTFYSDSGSQVMVPFGQTSVSV